MNETAYSYMNWPRIENIVYGEEPSPKDVMGAGLIPEGILIQGYFPGAKEAQVLTGGQVFDMELEDEAGYFAVVVPGRKVPEYKYHVTWEQGEQTFPDAYAFPGQITQEEEKAFCAGVYYHAYEKLGAHPMELNGVKGTYFAVWAPNAVRVSVVGSFCNWDGRRLMMHRMPMSGIFELFVPGVKAGDCYNYELKLRGGEISIKTDPYAFQMGVIHRDHSVVADLRDFQWSDEAWMENRKKYADRKQPLTIYETSLSSWQNEQDLVNFVSGMGYTHVELHPVMECLDEGSSGYATFGYYAPAARYGSPEHFRQLVDHLHGAGVGVILDWTPAHFPQYYNGLKLYDGTPLYEVKDPAMAVHPKWDTLLFNYESPMVKDFLIANAFYWMEMYHADGLRMDDVDSMLYLDYGRNPGQWTPNIYGTNENLFAVEFLKHLNSIVKKNLPGVLLIAQEDGLWPQLTDSVENDHLGFDYKWSGGWTSDLVSYLSRKPEERKDYHDQLTLSSVYAYSEHYVLTLGSRDVGNLENFMSVLPGTSAQKLAQVRAAYAYQILHPGCKMTAPDPDLPEGLGNCLRDLNALYRSQPALYEKDDDYEGFEWIQLMKSEENVLAFLRRTDKPEETLLAVCNFSETPYLKYPVGVPFYGKYKEIFNSDRAEYDGDGTVNSRARTSRTVECDEREYSIRVSVPALGVAVFSCIPVKEAVQKKETGVSGSKSVKTTGAKKTVKAAGTKRTAKK